MQPHPPPAQDPEAASQLVDMAAAIELLKTTRATFYRWLRSGKLKGMKVGRQWRFRREELERFIAGEEPRIALQVDPLPLLHELHTLAASVNLAVEGEANDTPPVFRAVDLALRLGLHLRASDIHFTMHPVKPGEETRGVLRWRVDGLMKHPVFYDRRLQPALVERLKQMAGCNVNEHIRPQDGRIVLNIGGKELDLRICFVPGTNGESVTLRILDSSAVMLSLDRFRLTQENRQRIDRALHAPNGLILVTGPTGSGKTTMLYACLNEVATPERKVLSVEDPVEYILPWITQVPVRAAEGVTFASVLRAFLRSDPDVIMVGELRDLQTASVCVQAALTGHLVLSTMHTDEAASALTRMVDVGLDPFLVIDATRLVVAQRLVRILCQHCKRPAKPEKELLVRARRTADSSGIDWEAIVPDFHQPVGCDRCGNLGFRGRLALMETLPVTPAIAHAMRERADAERLRAVAIGEGMTTMVGDGIRRAAAGETTLGEVFRVLPTQAR